MSQQVKEYVRRQALRWRDSLVHLFTLSRLQSLTNTTPFRTNGGLTTLALSFLSRTSTATVSPGTTPAGTRASAIDFPSVGENVPLVISPSPFAVTTF